MKSYNDFLEGWNNSNEPLHQLKDQNGLQPLFKSAKQRMQQLGNKKYCSVKQDKSKYNPQLDTSQNKTARFLSTIRRRRMLKKEEAIVQIKNYQASHAKQQQTNILQFNETQPFEQHFQQIGNKKNAQHQYEFKVNSHKCTISTTLYQCFDKSQKTKYMLHYSNGNKQSNDEKQYTFKNGNLQKILRMKQKLRRKNHSHMQKIKRTSAQGCATKPQSNKTQKNMNKIEGIRSPHYTLDLRPKKLTSLNPNESKVNNSKTQSFFYKNVDVLQESRRNSTSNGIRLHSIEIIQNFQKD